MNWTWRWTGQQLGGLLRHGELRVLGIALAVAVAAASAVHLFSDRVARAIAAQSGETLGADLIFSSRDPLAAELRREVLIDGIFSADTVNLPSVIWRGEESHLAGVKAVSPGYPLRGALRIADEAYAPERATEAVPPPGEAWVDIQLWNALALSTGDTLEVGAVTLRVSALLAYEPDRGTGFIDIAPRLLMNAADLPATELLAPGSRAQYRLMLAGDEAALAEARAIDLPRGVKRIGPKDARPEIRSAVTRAEAFLALAAMSATLLGAAAIALCARQYGARLAPDVALLRCLGASHGAIVRALLTSLLAIGLAAGGLGAGVGLAAQWLLSGLADALLLQGLPPPRLWPVLQALAVGLSLLAGFALPPLLAATRTPPVQVFQRSQHRDIRGGLWTVLALAALLLALRLQSPDWALIASVGGGQLATAAVLALAVWLALKALNPLRGRSLAGWRLGLGNLLRRPALSLAQTTALGLGLLALMLLTVVRTDLLRGWQERLPPDTPNQFLINIQAQQLDPLRAFLAERGITAQRIWPMARARLLTINGQTVNAENFADEEARRWINRDFNLSWTDTLGDDNQITAGQWWGEDGQGQAWLSADDTAQERLDLKLGDTLGFDLAGQRVELTVTNFREVDWESFQPNFFLLAPPGVLDDAPATWLTSFYLPPDMASLPRELADQFPGITLLDMGAMMAQVRTIIDRIVGALEFVFLFTVAAGLTVLLAAMEVGRQERRREIALMRTLGATRARVRGALLTEFAALGLLSGLVAALAAQLCGWLLASQVFEFEYQLNFTAVLLGAAGGAALVALLAWVSLRPVLDTPPDRVLRM